MNFSLRALIAFPSICGYAGASAVSWNQFGVAEAEGMAATTGVVNVLAIVGTLRAKGVEVDVAGMMKSRTVMVLVLWSTCWTPSEIAIPILRNCLLVLVKNARSGRTWRSYIIADGDWRRW